MQHNTTTPHHRLRIGRLKIRLEQAIMANRMWPNTTREDLIDHLKQQIKQLEATTTCSQY
jgi:hypothetical protein